MPIHATTLALAVLIDHLAGEPRRWHPLAGFGWIATKIEHAVYPQGLIATPSSMRLRGIASVALVVAPFVVGAWVVSSFVLMGPVFDVVLLYLTIGARSLAQHARAVSRALENRNLDEARRAIGMIVSRDTAQMNEDDVARAACESVLENGSDAIFGALFWFLVFGAPGAVVYRLINTLDAMWGYRNARYQYFGWAAARADDVLGFIPARLTALTYMLLGQTRSAWRCWITQARTWYSPNAGPVMAAGAGALDIELGGPARYHGEVKIRPILGCGVAPRAHDIARAVRLVQCALVLWVTVALTGALAIGWLHV